MRARGKALQATKLAQWREKRERTRTTKPAAEPVLTRAERIRRSDGFLYAEIAAIALGALAVWNQWEFNKDQSRLNEQQGKVNKATLDEFQKASKARDEEAFLRSWTILFANIPGPQCQQNNIVSYGYFDVRIPIWFHEALQKKNHIGSIFASSTSVFGTRLCQIT